MEDGQPPPQWSAVRSRWLAPVLLLLGAVLGMVWWEVTAPPPIGVAHPWHDGSGALLVPYSAVRNVDADRGLPGPPYVFVIVGGMVRRTPVRLGVVTTETIEIRDGLDTDALIAANPPRGLEDRHKVLLRP